MDLLKAIGVQTRDSDLIVLEVKLEHYYYFLNCPSDLNMQPRFGTTDTACGQVQREILNLCWSLMLIKRKELYIFCVRLCQL